MVTCKKYICSALNKQLAIGDAASYRETTNHLTKLLRFYAHPNITFENLTGEWQWLQSMSSSAPVFAKALLDAIATLLFSFASSIGNLLSDSVAYLKGNLPAMPYLLIVLHSLSQFVFLVLPILILACNWCWPWPWLCSCILLLFGTWECLPGTYCSTPGSNSWLHSWLHSHLILWFITSWLLSW